MSFIRTFKDGRFKNANELMTWIVFGDDKRFGGYKINRGDNTF